MGERKCYRATLLECLRIVSGYSRFVLYNHPKDWTFKLYRSQSSNEEWYVVATWKKLASEVLANRTKPVIEVLAIILYTYIYRVSIPLSIIIHTDKCMHESTYTII